MLSPLGAGWQWKRKKSPSQGLAALHGVEVRIADDMGPFNAGMGRRSRKVH